MQKLSVEDTQELVNSYVKSFGQSGAAKQLTEKGYRSPEGSSILQAHIYRILNGSSTCLLAPDQENQQQEPPITKEPIASIPKRAKQIAEELFANEQLLRQEIIETGEQLKQELEDEQAALEEMERTQPALVPLIESRPYREARHLEKDIRVSAVFNRRAPVELDEELTFYGIPRLRKSVEVKSRPHQVTKFGANVLSTRDLNVRPKNRS
jgi:hypothetical protein